MEVNPSMVAVAPLALTVWIIAFLPGKALVVMLVGAIMDNLMADTRLPLDWRDQRRAFGICLVQTVAA